jgi:predicted nucleic acid-binding protein
VLTLDANIWVAAFDPKDRFHESSVAFLRAVARRKLRLHGPSFVTLEVACALARRAGDSAVGAVAHARLRSHPALLLHPMNDLCLSTAQEIGTAHLLRGADALYAATAQLATAPLVTWDEELVQRIGATTPSGWLTDNA